LVARLDDEYINIAVKLARSPDQRRALRSSIKLAHDSLFDDVSTVRALEAAIERMVAGQN
jgi:predicted O-linked N-acetylglucosamine transferase (SPINDLY family)